MARGRAAVSFLRHLVSASSPCCWLRLASTQSTSSFALGLRLAGPGLAKLAGGCVHSAASQACRGHWRMPSPSGRGRVELGRREPRRGGADNRGPDRRAFCCPVGSKAGTQNAFGALRPKDGSVVT